MVTKVPNKYVTTLPSVAVQKWQALPADDDEQ
jgi:hypothetical protein